MRHSTLTFLVAFAATCTAASAAEVELNGRRFTLPDGMELTLAAGPPLVERPICADFDHQGRLYVAESSGTNDKIQKQLADKPHRILRLTDTDGDGRFDARTVFADKMMFPEGATWLAGSLYVAAPPVIWKLTDTDGDGRADRREEWFNGQTLTGCANDLHGPYRGPDGWVYWCKGAFAQQTHPRPGREPLVTRAAHIFRRRPQGGPVEAVMTGGMDNPVEVIFTPEGERVFTTTFLQHPRGGRRDGLIHAVYGGVYGKRHHVIEGHPRTGDLMPVLVHLGAAAPCGLARVESGELGEGYRNNVLAALFNMRKITRHVLREDGATYRGTDEDFLVCEHLDFHPTDVLEDADGSLLVIDTGGWYKLCCPTSQLRKPDVPGAIYRACRRGGHRIDDPRGKKINWAKSGAVALARLSADRRHAVRQRAGDELSRRGNERGEEVVAAIARQAAGENDPRARIDAVWTLTRIDGAAARAAVRRFLDDADPRVRQAALHSVSVHRDRAAVPQLLEVLSGESLRRVSPHNRRAAAEALGRLDDPRAVPALLAAAGKAGKAGKAGGRVLEHSLTFALIELARAKETAAGLSSENPATVRAALIALDQMPGGGLTPRQVVPRLDSEQRVVRDTALWIVDRHPEWAGDLVGYFQRQLSAKLDAAALQQLQPRLARFTPSGEIQNLLAASLQDAPTPPATRRMILRAMSAGAGKTIPPAWVAPLVRTLADADEQLAREAVATLRGLPPSARGGKLAAALAAIVGDARRSDDLRIQALAAAGPSATEIDDSLLAKVLSRLPAENTAPRRSLAADALSGAALSSGQLLLLADVVPKISPLDLDRVLTVFQRHPGPRLGERLVTALAAAPAASSLPADQLKAKFSRFDPAVRKQVDELCASLAMSTEEKRARLDEMLSSLAGGDARRGQIVFNGAKASCSACHAIGYLGGDIGPDLTRIGRIRTSRDLLEAILEPNASFVRSYEPVVVVTTRGQVVSGLLREDSDRAVVVIPTDRKPVRIPRSEVEELRPGTVSIMPSGLNQQLSSQELADLIEFLKASQ